MEAAPTYDVITTTKRTLKYNEEYYQSLEQDTEKWLEARKEFDLTGSEFAAALGMKKFMTHLELYNKKKNDLLFEEAIENNPSRKEACQYGIKHKKDAIDFFSQLNDSQLHLVKTGIRIIDHPTLLLGVSPDRLVFEGKESQQQQQKLVAIYQAKCPLSQKLFDSPRLEYIIQVHSHIQALNVSHGYLHCWTPQRSRIWKVQRDDIVWTLIIQGLEKFVMQHLRTNIPPSANSDSDLVKEKDVICKRLNATITLIM